MPEPGERKSNWEETWAEAFEEGFYDNVDGAEDPDRKALIVETDAQGRTRVVGVAEGAEAERLIAEAEASGLEVHRNASQVEELLQEQSGATDVPAEIYELMSTVMDFARELSEEWVGREAEILPRAGRVGREIEFSHEDVETGTYP
jgi:type III secretion system FlhB-like substrate exporter